MPENFINLSILIPSCTFGDLISAESIVFVPNVRF